MCIIMWKIVTGLCAHVLHVLLIPVTVSLVFVDYVYILSLV